MAETMFAGDHGPDNAWRSEKGRMLAPYELSVLESTNEGEPRFNGEVNPYNWEDTLVESGEYDPQKVVRGTDKHMPR